MKKKIITGCLLVAASILANAQGGKPIKKLTMGKAYTTIIKTPDRVEHGYLAGVTDSSVLLSSKKIELSGNASPGISIRSIDYNKIETVGFRKSGRVLKTIGIGALIGGSTGALIGIVSYGSSGGGSGFDFGPGLSAVAGAGIGMATGILFGALLGSQKIKFTINRSKDQFKKMKEVVL